MVSLKIPPTPRRRIGRFRPRGATEKKPALYWERPPWHRAPSGKYSASFIRTCQVGPFRFSKKFVRPNIRHTNDFGTTRAGSLPAVDEQSCPVRWPSARVARRRLNLRTQCRMHRSCPSHVDPQVRLVLARVRKQNCLSSHGLRRAGARGRKSMPKGKGRRVV